MNDFDVFLIEWYIMMIVKMICHVGNWYDDVDDDIEIDVTMVIIKYCTTCV